MSEETRVSQAGQQSERTPDFIPGWFIPRPGNVDTAEREAVRFIGTQDFPINFLRDGEAVWLPQPPQVGVCIGQRASDFCLGVPPGYWIVRDSDGRPQLWREEDFEKKWVRNNGRDWISPVERLRDNPHLTDEQRDQLRYVDGWQGTPPAEGTRRALILGVIDNFAVRLISGVGGKATKRSCLNLADEIESALLQSTIDDEAMARGAEALTAGIVDVDVEAGSTKLPEGMPEGLRHSERELWLRGDGDVRVLLDRISRLRSDEDLELLLEQRESARAGEDHWKAQRDAAFRLLQWVLPDLMGHPSDTLGADLADDAPEEDREAAPDVPDNIALSEQARAALAARIEEGRIDPDELIEIARLG